MIPSMINNMHKSYMARSKPLAKEIYSHIEMKSTIINIVIEIIRLTYNVAN